MAQLNFNAHAVDPSQPMSFLPVSDPNGHLVIIIASEMKAAKSNPEKNGFLELTLQIIDGQHKGETGAYRLNLFNESAQAVDIASRQLSAICHVTGQMMIAESSQLHNIPFRAIVALQKKTSPTDPDYTEIKGVLDINGNKPAKPGSAPPAQPTQAPAPTTAPAPWPTSAPQQPSGFAQPGAPTVAPTAKAPWLP
jgi:hypothetical protein